MSIFKACDIRGIFKEELTPDLAADIGRGIGTSLTGQRVIVGGDVRTSTAVLKERLIWGLVQSGCQVVDIGTVPTPAFNFARKFLGIPGGVMVTASHNPPVYNGFKISFDEWPVTNEQMMRLESIVQKKAFTKADGGSCIQRQVVDEYERFVIDCLQSFREESLLKQADSHISVPPPGFKVVIDCGNGCNSNIAPEVFRALGYHVIPLFCEEDGRFPNRGPNPAVSKNLEELSAKVMETRADLGIAFDGDGDRVIFVAENGRVVPSDQIIVLIARSLLRFNPGAKVVFDIKCSSLVADEIIKAGGIPRMERSGHSFIKTTLVREGAVFGGEISGHLFFRKLGGDDGLLAALVTSDIIRADGGGLQAMITKLPEYFSTPDIRLPYQDDDQTELLEALDRSLQADPDCRVSRLDGVRGEFAGGWGLIRPSVTESLLTLRFESKSKDNLTKIKDRFLNPIPKIKTLVDRVWSEYNG
jgi:phosphomannomutase / phosphoglucomutase